MKHLVVHLFIVLVVVCVSNTTTNLFKTREKREPKINAAQKLAPEDEIIATVFRHQLEYYFEPDHYEYYLSCYNYEDPPRAVMAYLSARNPAVKKLSDLNVRAGEGRVWVRVGRVNWINDSEVVVGGSYHRAGWGIAQSFIYHVVRENGVWKVTNSETIS